MGAFSYFESSNKGKQEDGLRVVRKNDDSVNFTGNLTVYKFIDNDTAQHLFYLPSLNLTAYGETEEKAQEMLKFCIADLFDILGSMNPKQRDLQLLNLGWRQNPFKNKSFSKAYIDPQGLLQNFNVAEGSLETACITV
jgi:hypothetical protein